MAKICIYLGNDVYIWELAERLKNVWLRDLGNGQNNWEMA